MTERAPARHRADLPPSTPLTGITSSITAVVGDHAATLGRGGVVVAVSSGLVAGMALPAAAATTVDTAQTASVPVLGGTASSAVGRRPPRLRARDGADQGKDLLRAQRLHGCREGPVAASTPASATREVATISRSLARAAYRAPHRLARPPRRLAAPAPRITTKRAGPARTRRTAPVRGPAAGGAPGPSRDRRVRHRGHDRARAAGGPARRRGHGRGGRRLAVPRNRLPLRGHDPAGFRLLRLHAVRLPPGRRRSAAHGGSAAPRRHRISRSAAHAGDLVFFLSGGYAYHVGIYLGNGKMVDSPRPARRSRSARSTPRTWRSREPDASRAAAPASDAPGRCRTVRASARPRRVPPRWWAMRWMCSTCAHSGLPA